jgi:predicted N-acetyltransferase YhbS
MSAGAPKVEFIEDAQIDAETDLQLRRLLCCSYGEPASTVFRQRRYYHEPAQYRWVIRDAGGVPVAHVAVHEKAIGTRIGDIKVAAVGELCVHPDHCGRGYVHDMLETAHEWLSTHGFRFALLVGNPDIYRSSGYALVDNVFRYRDGITEPWQETHFAHGMVRPLSALSWPPGPIDLRGPRF